MALDVVAIALSKKYTDESIAGGGISAGKNCVVDSITDITGGHRVTFKWTLDNGTVKTGTMDVMDGAKGDKGDSGDAGLGIKSVAVNTEDHLIITYDDDTTQDAGQIQVTAAVDSVNGKTGEVVLDASDVGALPDDTEIPSKTSDLTNDSNFVADASYVHTDNNYDATAKGIVDGVTAALADKVDKVQGKGLSTNDYTDADKEEVTKVADKADAEDVIDGASYDSANHLILFKNGTTTLFSLDAAAFVKDGMVDDVEIVDGNLVITFNTDAGKQAISIPLTDIFDPANYYTKTATDGLLADKADKVSGATNGNFAGLDANGNLTDSGKKAADFATPSDIAGQQSLLKDTVGWTGKNLLKYPYNNVSRTINGVTFTINSDGSVTANGTATATAIFVLHNQISMDYSLLRGKSFVISGGYGEERTFVECYMSSPESWYQDKNGKGRTFTFPEVEPPVYNMDIIVHSGTTVNNVKFYPMLRRADISDSTYEPYHDSVEVMYEEEIHGVNLLPLTTTRTINGVTFTANADGTVTANGTATDNTAFFVASLANLESGCKYTISDGNKSTANVYAFVNGRKMDDTWLYNVAKLPENESFTADYSVCKYYNYGIYVKTGETVNNLTFYPMLRKADIEDSTYRPYNEQSIQNQINAITGATGVRNLIPYPYYQTSVTHRGITFTSDSEGVVTFSGTGTDGNPAQLLLTAHTAFKLKKGTYTLSGGSSKYGGMSIFFYNEDGTNYSGSYSGLLKNSSNNIFITTTQNGAQMNASNLYGYDKTFTINSDAWVDIACRSVTTAISEAVSGTIYPMIRLASDPDNTYQPYAMTNRELTEKKISIADLKSVTAASSDFADFQTRIAAL